MKAISICSPGLPVRPEPVPPPDACVGPPPLAAGGTRGNEARVDRPEPPHHWSARLSNGTLKNNMCVSSKLIVRRIQQTLSHLSDWSGTVSFKVKIFEVISNRVHEGLKFLLRIKVRNEIVKV